MKYVKYIIIYVVLLAFAATVAPSQDAKQDTPQNLCGADGNLRLYRNGGESLSVSRSGKARTLVSAAKGAATRRTYDGDGRLTRVQTWSSSKKACIKEEIYSFDAGNKPSRCVVTDGDKSSGSWTVTDRRFNADGNAAEERVWSVEMVEDEDASTASSVGVASASRRLSSKATNDGVYSPSSKETASAAKPKKEERHLLKVVTKTYGADGNVAEVTTVTKGDDGKKHVVREKYDGRDTYRYENGVLRMSVVYSTGEDGTGDSTEDYTTTVVFGEDDSEVKIMTDYKDGRKVGTRVAR